jgi:hypothetical protein
MDKLRLKLIKGLVDPALRILRASAADRAETSLSLEIPRLADSRIKNYCWQQRITYRNFLDILTRTVELIEHVVGNLRLS